MKCLYCGSQYDDKFDICPMCGTLKGMNIPYQQMNGAENSSGSNNQPTNPMGISIDNVPNNPVNRSSFNNKNAAGMPNGPMGGPYGNNQMNGGMPNNQMNGGMPNNQMNGGMPNNQMNGGMPNNQMNGGMPNNQMNGGMSNGQMGGNSPYRNANGGTPNTSNQKPKNNNSLIIIIVVAAIVAIAFISIVAVVLKKRHDKNKTEEPTTSTVDESDDGEDGKDDDKDGGDGEEATSEEKTTSAEDDKTSTATGGNATASDVHVDDSKIRVGCSVEEVGSFDNPGMIQSWGGAPVVAQSENSAKIVFTDGSLSDVYYSVHELGDGLYEVVPNAEDSIHSVGLVNIDGEQLIPCEAGVINHVSRADGQKDNSRYLRVSYATEVTTDKNEAFIYSSDDMFSFMPDEDDTLYKGYAKVYDLKNKKFIEGVEITNPDSSSMVEIGNNFAIKDLEGDYHVYNEEGKEVYSGSANLGNGYILPYTSGGSQILDENGNLLYETEDNLSEVDSTSGLIKKYNDDGSTLIDKNGNQVLPESYKYIYSEEYGFVEVETDDEINKIVDLNGNVIVESSENITQKQGYFYYDVNDKYSLYGPDGLICENAESYPDNLILQSGSKLLVIKDKDYTFDCGESYVDGFTQGVAKVRNDAGMSGIFEAFTGQMILDYNYKSITTCGDYLYAEEDDSTCKVYKLVYDYR